MAKYSASTTVAKSAVPAIPFIIAELVSSFTPIPKETSMAVASLVVGIMVGVKNWLKNRKRAV